MPAVTCPGWESAIACDPPAISVVVAPMRWAAARSQSGSTVRSAPATVNQLGSFRQPGLTESAQPTSADALTSSEKAAVLACLFIFAVAVGNAGTAVITLAGAGLGAALLFLDFYTARRDPG